MSTTPMPAPEAQAAISPVGRLFGVLFSPGKTFEDVARKPSWLLPAIVLVVLSLLASALLSQRVNWRDVVSQQIEKSPQAAQLSADQKAQRIEMGAKIAPIIAYVGGLIGPIILLLLVGLVMWGAYSLFGGLNPGFEKSFAITAHSFMTAIVSTPLFILILFLKPRGTIDVENPMATNVAAFMGDGTAKWLLTFGKQIDIFTIWTLILLGMGFAAVNRKKLTSGKSIGIAFAVWIAYVVVRTGIAWVFS
jgi:hypothetical protein